jgi:Cof subfamily protein (haloacid dehalogenase superfamily)
VPIPLPEAREAIAEIDRHGFPLNCYVDDELYVAEMTPEAERYATFQNLPVHVVGPLLDWLDQEPTKLVVVNDPHVLDELEVELKAAFDGRLYISKSLPYFLELASPAVTKGSGLAFLAARLGFTPEQTVAFGDGENDVEMIEWAGYGVAMANGHDRVKALADWVCPPVTEEGVAQTIEAMLAWRS